MSLSSTEKEKPMFTHALIQGLIATALALFLATRYSWNVTAQTVSTLLRLTGIDVSYVEDLLTMYVKLPEGISIGFKVLIECSGLVTISVFAFISVFTVGLLRGSALVKIAWLLLSIGVGLTWNISRLILVVAVAYNFGFSAFRVVHYFLAPFIDFLWIVSMWAVGMSWLRRGEEL